MAAQFGRRLRRGAATTALAAAAIAALSASQAPSVIEGSHHGQASDSIPDDDSSATGDSPYYTDLPPLNSPTAPPSVDHPPSAGGAEAGIPATMLDAYKKAEGALARSQPGCNLRWELLAAIGKVESGQARGGRVDAQGTTLTPILGPVLNGHGFAAIHDTDGGRYDGDAVNDRAVGPMQFIPSTWAHGGPDHLGWGADGNGDGKKDPNNIYDAALAAGHYLCASGRDLSQTAYLHEAILNYNHSQNYLSTVLSWYEYYRKGTHEVPNGSGTLPHDRSDGTPGAGSGKPKETRKPNEAGGKGDSSKPGTRQPGDSGNSGSSGNSDPGNSNPGGGSGGDQSSEQTAASIKNAGTGTLTAMAGDAFTQRAKARVEDANGDPVSRVRVQFAIVGVTDASFDGGATTASVLTGTDGTATAPVLNAGDEVGDFTVRATVVGSTAPALDFDASVTPRKADALARTSTDELVCKPNAQFEQAVEVKATYKGAVAPGVAATATLIKSADDPTENTKGPYFKNDSGLAVHTLGDLKTDSNGVLRLPTLYTDDTTGTFLLRITTQGGAQLDVQLKVEAADSATATPTPTQTATASQDG